MTVPSLKRLLLDRHDQDPAARLILANAVECAVMLHDGVNSCQRSHLGGSAHEPIIGVPRPGTDLALLAEIFLDEVPHFMGREMLPDDGVLQAWADPEDPTKCRIMYYPADVALRIAATPSVFQKTPIRFQSRVSIMDHQALIWLAIDQAAGVEYDAFGDLVRRLRVDGIEMVSGAKIPTYDRSGYPTLEAFKHSTFAADIAHQLLGHPALVQEERFPPEQRLVLQFDSDLDGPGWMWGDGGVVWFHITDDALINRRFDEATCSWSSC